MQDLTRSELLLVLRRIGYDTSKPHPIGNRPTALKDESTCFLQAAIDSYAFRHVQADLLAARLAEIKATYNAW